MLNIQVATLIQDESYDKALELIMVIEMAENITPELLVAKSRCVLLSGNTQFDLEDAEKSLLLAIDLRPNYEEALLDLANFYLSVEDSAVDALPLFKKINNSEEAVYGVFQCLLETVGESETLDFIHENDTVDSEIKNRWIEEAFN